MSRLLCQKLKICFFWNFFLELFLELKKQQFCFFLETQYLTPTSPKQLVPQVTKRSSILNMVLCLKNSSQTESDIRISSRQKSNGRVREYRSGENRSGENRVRENRVRENRMYELKKINHLKQKNNTYPPPKKVH